MEYVIHCGYGVFHIPGEVCNKIGCNRYDDDDTIRTSPILIEWVKANQDKTNLRVREIPADATDWRVDEYDGWEGITCVVDGKLVDL